MDDGRLTSAFAQSPFGVHKRAEQERLLALPTNSTLVVADQSGPVIPFDEPAVVAEAVRRVLLACRTKGRVK